MNTNDLDDHILSIHKIGSGTYHVTIEYRGKLYSCYSHNTLAIDRIRSREEFRDRSEVYFYTYKGALYSLYDECKRDNNL